MSRPEKFFLYRVTRTEETFPSSEPVSLGIVPHLDPRWLPWLKTLHPFFEEELWFDVGDSKTVPLTEHLARGLANRKWDVKRRGHGQPVNDGERKLIQVCEQRFSELEAARNEVLSYTNPYGDYARAGLVGRLLRLSEVSDDLERLKASGIVTEEVADTMASVVARLLELRSELEAKGWRFDSDGSIREPSSGGRPPRYPRSVIRAHYRQLETIYAMSGSSTDFVDRVRRDLEPVFGDLCPRMVHEILKTERERLRAKKPRRPAGART